MAFWRLLSGIAFEKELGALFKMMGDIAKETPRSGDGGVDLLLSMNGQLTAIIVSTLGDVGRPAIRAGSFCAAKPCSAGRREHAFEDGRT